MADDSRTLLCQNDTLDPPCPAGDSVSNLVAITMDENLEPGTDVVRLSDCPDYEMYVVGSHMASGRLYLGYMLNPCLDVGDLPSFHPRMKVFDTEHEYQLLDAIALTSDDVPAERVTMAEVDGKVYVAYTTNEDHQIFLKVFGWQEAPADWSPDSCP